MKKTATHQNLDFVQIDQVKALFQTKSLGQRLVPVLAELLTFIAKPNPQTRPSQVLPHYCHQIFKALRGTQFRALPDSSESFKESSGMDWDALGRVIGAGLRCFRFAELEMKDVLQREISVTKDTADLCEILTSLPELGQMLKPSMPLVCEAKPFVKGSEELWSVLLTTSQSAYQCGRDPLAQLTGAIQKGVEGFLDADGHCVVEHARDNIYWFLLIVWPEIQKMQRAKPPITRKDFADWLEPFSHAGLVSIRDLDQLLDVCDDIGLKFKGRGAPRKK